MDQIRDYALGPCTASYRTIIDPLPTRETATRTFPLLKLPPEVRAIVFEPLIQAGDLSILRVSKLIGQEAAFFVPKLGTFRIDQGSRGFSRATIALAEMTLLRDHTMMAPSHIQNLDIRLDPLGHTWSYIYSALIAYFSGNEIARRSCEITILIGLHGPGVQPPDECAIYRLIASLTGFKTLTLKFKSRKNEDREAEISKSNGCLPVTSGQAMLHKKILKSYKEISEFLARTLGPAKLNDSLDEPYLLFKPRTNRALE